MTWIITHTGQHTNPLDLNAADVEIENIAHALSNICRFGGHTPEFYSVAQHSVRVAAMVSEYHPSLYLAALLHDAAEAFLGDVVRPIKQTSDMALYHAAEARAMRAIYKAYGIKLSAHERTIIDAADKICMGIEGKQFFGDISEWDIDVTEQDLAKYPSRFECLAPDKAKAAFLFCFATATGGEIGLL